MAIFNEILVGRFNRSLQKAFGIKGSPPVRQIAGEIQPGYQILTGVENRYLEGWDRFGINLPLPAVAGQFSLSRLRNPVGSNMIAVFERITVSGLLSDSNPTIQAQASGADLVVQAIGGAGWDPRGRANPTLISSINTVGTPAVGFFIKYAGAYPANGFFDFVLTDDQEIALLPGMAIQVQQGVVNQAFDVAWLWRERYLEESERS
jgi:hypothetical protein